MASGDGTPRTYSIATETASAALNMARLRDEILAETSITTAYSYINQNGDDLQIYFAAALSAPEITALDTLVGAHTGAVVRDWVPVAIDPSWEPVEPGASRVVANDRLALQFETGLTSWVATQATWPFELSSTYAELRITVRYILPASGTGIHVRIAARVKGQGIGEDSSAAFAVTEVLSDHVTHTTVGEVFQAQLTLDASSFEEGDALALQVGRDGNDEIAGGTGDDCDQAIQVISVKVEGR